MGDVYKSTNFDNDYYVVSKGTVGFHVCSKSKKSGKYTKIKSWTLLDSPYTEFIGNIYENQELNNIINLY